MSVKTIVRPGTEEPWWVVRPILYRSSLFASLAILALAIAIFLLYLFNFFAPWKRSNPPEWVRVAENDESYFEINTRLVVPQTLDQVVVVTRETPKDNEAGRHWKGSNLKLSDADKRDHPGGVPYALVSVEAYVCDSKNPTLNTSQFVTMSIFAADASSRPLTDRIPGNVDSVIPGSVGARVREAGCWLRDRANQKTRIPYAFKPRGGEWVALGLSPFE
jgi:hypothetical protein